MNQNESGLVMNLVSGVNFRKTRYQLSVQRFLGQRREVSVKFKFVKLWVGQHIQREQDKKMSLFQKSVSVQICIEILAPVCSDDSIQILLKMASIMKLTIQACFRGIYMKSSQQRRCLYLLTNLQQRADVWQLNISHLSVFF